MTGITGYDAHAPPRPFPHHVDRLTRGVIDYDSGNPVRTWRMGRSDSRRPLRRGLFASSWNDGRRRYPRVRRTNGGADIGHDPHGHDCPAGNSQRAWTRIERCTGIEPASSVWKTETLTVVLTPRKKRNPRTRFTLIFSSGFLSGHLGPRTRTSTHRGWRAVHLHQCPAWSRVMITCPCVRLTEDSLQRRPVGTPMVSIF